MKIKFVLTTSAGALDHAYANAAADPGGYIDIQSVALPKWLLAHGDTIKVEFLDQLAADERTAEDEREIAADDRREAARLERMAARERRGAKARAAHLARGVHPSKWEV